MGADTLNVLWTTPLPVKALLEVRPRPYGGVFDTELNDDYRRCLGTHECISHRATLDSRARHGSAIIN